jgi:hypothetical protein
MFGIRSCQQGCRQRRQPEPSDVETLHFSIGIKAMTVIKVSPQAKATRLIACRYAHLDAISAIFAMMVMKVASGSESAVCAAPQGIPAFLIQTDSHGAVLRQDAEPGHLSLCDADAIITS